MSTTGIQPIVPDWPAPAPVRAFATTRDGGVSTGDYAGLNLGDHVGDAALAVANNRRLLEEQCKLPAAPRWLTQVHGPLVVVADEVSVPFEADAAWTDSNDVVCAVMTADCLPVLLCDRAGNCVAAAHAGWRGLCSGVLELTVDRFLAAAVLPDDVLVWLGPAISAAAYEVDARVRDAFLDRDVGCEQAFVPTRPGHWQLDLYAAARGILAAQGVVHVYGGSFCTFSDARFFSHRRDSRCGRQAALIWLAG